MLRPGVPRFLPSVRRLAVGLARRLAVAAPLVVATPLAATAQFSSITFFGDDYTDTGNLDIYSQARVGLDLTPSPPYAPGVMSNGQNWAQYLAAALGRPGDASAALRPVLGLNYAFGTARTGTFGGVLPGQRFRELIGLGVQTSIFDGFCSSAWCPPGRTGDPTGLYVLLIGANNIRDAASLGAAAERTAALTTAINNINGWVASLYDRGARSFLISDIWDVGLAPEELGNPARTALLGQLTDEFNTLLAARIALSRDFARRGSVYGGSTFYELHLGTLFDAILGDAAGGGARYGITNTTIPCFAAGAPSCDASLFVDAAGRPTTAVHRLMAQAAYDRVVPTAAPEPATLSLAAAGLAVLGAGAARRRLRGDVRAGHSHPGSGR